MSDDNDQTVTCRFCSRMPATTTLRGGLPGCEHCARLVELTEEIREQFGNDEAEKIIRGAFLEFEGKLASNPSKAVS